MSRTLTENSEQYFKLIDQLEVPQYFKLNYKSPIIMECDLLFEGYMQKYKENQWIYIEGKPKNVTDFLEVKKSLVCDGLGLFAKVKLPKSVILGCYKGLIWSIKNFEDYKEGLNEVDRYSIKWDNCTIIDGTDYKGEPITNPLSIGYCLFHFMNEKSKNQINCEYLKGKNRHEITIETNRNIIAGEELFTWYGENYIRDYSLE